MAAPKPASGTTEAKARRVRAHFARAGFAVGAIYQFDSDEDDEAPDAYGFWVYAQRKGSRATDYDTNSALGEIHVTPLGVRAEGIEARSPAPILERLLRK